MGVETETGIVCMALFYTSIWLIGVEHDLRPPRIPCAKRPLNFSCLYTVIIPLVDMVHRARISIYSENISPVFKASTVDSTECGVDSS